MTITADLRTSKITCAFDVDAPRDGRPTTRINWLVRQLKDSTDRTRVEAHFARGQTDAAELLRDLRTARAKLVVKPAREIKSFTVALDSPAGAKRSSGRGGFIDSVVDAVDAAYEEIGQGLRAWSAAPPRLRSETEVVVEEDVADCLPSAALSSQDD